MKYIIFALCVLLVACQSTSSHRQSDLPSWWTSPPTDSSQWLYGLGEGPTLEQANQQALANLAGKFRTTINSSLSRHTQSTYQHTIDRIERDITSNISDISLSNYETLQTQVSDQNILVLVRVNKISLANDWLSQYRTIQRAIQKTLEPDTKNLFQWWLKAQSMKSQALEGDQLAELYSTLTNTQKSSRLLNQLNQTLLQNKPMAAVKGDVPEISDTISQELVNQGINVGSCRPCDLTVSYKTYSTSEKLFGENVVQLRFEGDLKDRNYVFSSRSWNVSASSIQGSQAGIEATRFIAIEKIKGEGLWKTFGIEAK